VDQGLADRLSEVEQEYGEVEGMLADPVVLDDSPRQKLKVLYGNGGVRLNDETGAVERVGGIRYTVKDGIVYDARKMLADVRERVRRAKEAVAASGGGT